MRVVMHHNLSAIWVRAPPLDTAGYWRPPVYLYNWLLGPWRHGQT